MSGRVASGRGDLAQWLRRYSDSYERAVGAREEPGSHSVVLDEPWVMSRAQARLEASRPRREDDDEVSLLVVGEAHCRDLTLSCSGLATHGHRSGRAAVFGACRSTRSRSP